MSSQQRFDFGASEAAGTRDAEARRHAVDPTRNVALEASAGTGKTRVLVDRYIALLVAGVEPRQILAVTFTRKAAAEMRRRILEELARKHEGGTLGGELWRSIRERAGEIGISTIDAFCLALLREFPLEADVNPGFGLADETETPHLMGDALDRALRIGRALAVNDPDVALVFADLGEYRLRTGLARLLDRRLVAADALNAFVQRADITAAQACSRLVSRLNTAFATQPGGVERFLASGPVHAGFSLFAQDLRELLSADGSRPELIQGRLERVRSQLLTQKGEARRKLEHRIDEFRSRADYDRYKAAVLSLAPYLVEALDGFRTELNLVLARGVRRLFAVSLDEYRRTLRQQNLLDFSELLARALALLRRMDEFSRSRFRLESRYQHVLVDEFQDTSRAQWELVELLIRSWSEGEGMGGSALQPSIFIVGDRKQSIYRFRDAEAAVLDEAARYIDALRPMAQVRHSITRSFRSVREVLAFANDLFGLVDKRERGDAFRYDDRDAFALTSADDNPPGADTPLGLAMTLSDEDQANAVAEEIARLLIDRVPVRDRELGVRREVTPGDIAVLFRTRESHRVFEAALERRGVPFYVYKGLGFFDTDEIKDVLALLAYLAVPHSNLRAAAFLRSRFVGLSDQALKELAPGLTAALTAVPPPEVEQRLAPADRIRLSLALRVVPQWLSLADRLSPSELLDRALLDSAYAAELGGAPAPQARENLKKIRGLVRRIQNRGYATLSRLVQYFSHMVAGGDESNAIVDAVDAVNLMTVHAAKGLEFPVVFVVNLSKGSGGSRDPIRVSVAPRGEDLGASVAVGEHESEADRDEDAREVEETKRLLYVALTRPRDRLYLTSTLGRDGKFPSVRGSLGRVFPASFVDVLSRAGNDLQAPLVTWVGPAAAHQFRVLRPSNDELRVLSPEKIPGEAIDDFAALPSPAAGRRIAVTEVLAGQRRPGQAEGVRDGRLEDAGNRLSGSLVHRALQAGIGLEGETLPTGEDLRPLIAALVEDEERVIPDEVDRAVRHAAVLYAELLRRPSLRKALGRPGVLHETALSRRLSDGSTMRGTLDCIVRTADNHIIVLDFKTGAPSSDHDAQLALYVEAIRASLPSETVEGHLIYAGQQLSNPRGV